MEAAVPGPERFLPVAQRGAVAFDTDRVDEWLLTEAARTDHDVAAAVQEEVGIGEEPVKAALTAEMQLTSAVPVVRCGSAEDAEPYQRAAAGGTND